VSAPRGDSEQTKAEILAAAQRLFAEQGISAVSVRDVASEAGVTHGLIHHYFGTKEQLAAAAIRAAVSASAEVLVANPVDTDLASLDVMELNPALDVRNQTAVLAVDLIESLFGKSTLMRK